jgi:TolB protein
MVHKFADQIVFRYTGEAGVADTRLVFASRVTKGKELFVCDYDGHDVKPITAIKSIIISPRWSPSGLEVVFTSFHTRNPSAYWLNLRTGNINPVLKGTPYINSAASWSPDGKMIVFAMSMRGNFDIYTVYSDGSGLKRLTTAESIETSPNFSPDGKYIVYVSDKPGKPQLYIMNADGTNAHRFTYNGDYNADPVWSPKGDKIAYAALTGDNFNISVKSLDGAIEKQLTANAGKNESPSWSADGRHIAFTSSRTGERQVYIMNANGESQIQVTNMPSGAYGVSWSPR